MRRYRIRRWSAIEGTKVMELSVRAPGGSSKSLGRVWSTGELWGWESADGTRGGLESTRECAMRSLEIEARA